VLVRSKGYEELYAHLAAWNVHVGERLAAGQVIRDGGVHRLVHRHASALRGAQARLS
jgi:hypothetical protein